MKITFTYKDKKEFRSHVTYAERHCNETFTYLGHVLETTYARYLCEYLDMVLPYPEYTGLTKPIKIEI